MEYGPAIQASLGSIQLVDKLHTGASGEYLELIGTDANSDVASLLYRKVIEVLEGILQELIMNFQVSHTRAKHILSMIMATI